MSWKDKYFNTIKILVENLTTASFFVLIFLLLIGVTKFFIFIGDLVLAKNTFVLLISWIILLFFNSLFNVISERLEKNKR